MRLRRAIIRRSPCLFVINEDNCGIPTSNEGAREGAACCDRRRAEVGLVMGGGRDDEATV